MSQTLDYLLKLTDSFSGPMARARSEQDRFIAAGKDLGRNAGQVNNLGSAFGGLAAKIGAAFTAYKVLEAGFSGIKKSLSMASAAETTATAFKTMLGSGEAAGALIEKIKKLGAETPFEFPELANAGRMLLAFGEAAADIPDTLRRIGDVSSAVAAPIGDIAEIYGKARTAGTLFSEDINQLTGRGIPIIREFAKILKQPESAIKKLAEEGKITFPMLDQAFRNLTGAGGQFFGMMEEQAKTSAGLWSTLSDAVGALYLRFGEPLNDAIKPILNDAIGLAGKLEPLVKSLGSDVAVMVTSMRNFVADAGNGAGLGQAMGAAISDALASAFSKALIPFKAAWAGMASLGKDLMGWLEPVGDWFAGRMISAAQLFSAEMMRGIADALDKVPLMGDAAKAARDQAAALQGAGEKSGVKADRAGERAANSTGPKQVWASLDRAMAATSADLAKSLPPTPTAGADLPMSVLDPSYNSLFPGGVPKGQDTSKLPPSVLGSASGLGLPGLQGGMPALPTGQAEEVAREKVLDESLKTNEATLKTEKSLLEQKQRLLALTGQEATAGGPAPLSSAKSPGAEGGGRKKEDRYDEDGRRKTDGRRKIVRRLDDGTGDYSLTPFSGRLSTRTGPLSMRTGPLSLPSPGLAKRDQERRETAATASRSAGGTHPLAAEIKAIAAKLNSLAVAS